MKNAESLKMTLGRWMIRASFLVIAAFLAFFLCSDGRTIIAESNAAIFQEDSLNLQQNYPNPFSVSTEIRYGVSDQGVVLIRIYNTLGQEISVLVDNEEKQPGVEYAVRFDGSVFPSGQYTYVMNFTSDEDGSKTKLIKRMQLIR